MATTYTNLYNVEQPGVINRNQQYPILTTSTYTAGNGDVYIGVWNGSQPLSVSLSVQSTAVVSVYTTNSPLQAIQAGTAIWNIVASLTGVTGQAANIGTLVSITGPFTGITTAVTTGLAGFQATISINAGKLQYINNN